MNQTMGWQVSALYLGLLVDASVRVEPNRTGRP